jgi:RNA polymerase sigma-70 factor (ECF subfamily)
MLGDRRTAEFALERKRMLRLSYRMLGSITEAEDVVQDAWLRWAGNKDQVRIRPPISPASSPDCALIG